VAPALLWGWLITFFGGWLEEWLSPRRPVRIALVGQQQQAEALARGIEAEAVSGHRVVGYVREQVGSQRDASGGIEWLGGLDDLRSLVVRHKLDLLVLASPDARLKVFEEVANCLDLPVRIAEVTAFYEELHGRVPLGTIDAAWFECIMHPSFSPGTPPFKRLLDFTVASVASLLALPFFALLAFLVKFMSEGPVLYRQRRVGERGREFELLKFRTMRLDAEADGRPAWAVADDERVTPAGRLLRRTHLDELPQLYNVLRGDMSLVGPRPERPELVSDLEASIPYYQRRHLIKPGLTGWAQLRCGYGGTPLGTVHKLCHDLYYLKHRSPAFDLLIIVETLRTLVRDRQFGRDPAMDPFIVGEEAILTEAVSPAVGEVAVSGPLRWEPAPASQGSG
jgi:exopolysaccharide biosynthesis polyprenyl glycosylphosphotransferase